MEAFKIKNGISAKRYLGSNGTETAGSVGYNLAGASYDSKSLSTEAVSIQQIYFKTDGLTAYSVHSSTDTAYQYTLSTAWDVSTGAYASKSFSFAGQDSDPLGMYFKPDGTKVYISGLTSQAVYQYSLSTAWDISTASYDSVSLSTSSQDIPRNIFFKTDGTKFYIVGISNDTVYQYTLSTAWDLSTASYDSVSFSVASQDSNSTGLYFRPDGTEMYTVGATNDSVYLYNLSTAWDVSTASYSNTSFNVNAQDAGPVTVFFDTNGTKMYVSGQFNNNIEQYSTASYTQTLDLSTGTTFSFTPSGATTVSFTNPPASGNAIGFSVEINGDGSAITWPSSIKWHEATAPTATATKELYTFVTTDGGTTYYGKKAAEGVS